MAKYTMTFSTFLKKTGLSEEQGQELIAQSQDQVEFCERVSKQTGTELTLQQAADIYETAPLKD
jgi:hypothetical protein